MTLENFRHEYSSCFYNIISTLEWVVVKVFGRAFHRRSAFGHTYLCRLYIIRAKTDYMLEWVFIDQKSRIKENVLKTFLNLGLFYIHNRDTYECSSS